MQQLRTYLYGFLFLAGVGALRLATAQEQPGQLTPQQQLTHIQGQMQAMTEGYGNCVRRTGDVAVQLQMQQEQMSKLKESLDAITKERDELKKQVQGPPPPTN